MSLTNRLHDFNPRDRTAGRPKGFEPQHGTREPLHCSMVLLYEIIKIFRVTHDNVGLVSLVVVHDRCRVAATLINGNLLREPLSTNSLV